MYSNLTNVLFYRKIHPEHINHHRLSTMGLLKNISGIFGGEKENTGHFDWNVIESTGQLNRIMEVSRSRPQVIFKHSPRCATSFFAKNNLESFPPVQKKQFDFHFVDVIRSRDISTFIASLLETRHESPQVFVIRNQQVIWHGSHQQVQNKNILKAVNNS